MPFVKGQSGNPGGRKKGDFSLTDMLRKQLSKREERDKITERLVSMAQSGNLDAIKVIFDRIDGKVPEIRQLAGRVQINLTWGDDDGDSNPV